MLTLYTIGFTKKTAQQFFELLKKNHVQQLVDVRINNSSQLAGFAKGKDLEYFVKEICHIPYVHKTELAPTKDLLDKWHREEVTWKEYTQIYNGLLKERNVARKYPAEQYHSACFLCSEETPEFCHRRLLVEFLKANSSEVVKIVHLQ